MLKFDEINPSKNAVIFELDDVLIPKKDYDLQVYYLFANFIEYLETFPPSQEMLAFISKRYELHGNTGMFDEIAVTFGVDKKYEENLALLFKTAKLPLKLLLFKESLALLQELVINRKQLFILTAGTPEQQLNKIKQTEWNGLDKYLKVYFKNEFMGLSAGSAMLFLLKENDLNKDEAVFVGSDNSNDNIADLGGVDFLSIK
jgi:FMN phosphatase YigB (HAD superfamily)